MIIYLERLFGEGVGACHFGFDHRSFIKDVSCGLTNQPLSGVITRHHADTQREKSISVEKIHGST